ncbi:MAG: archease [Anaerolineales bacterium]
MEGPAQEITPCGYQEVDHVADRAYRIWGPDLGGLLSSGARALYDLAGIQPDRGREVERCIEVCGLDREGLLVAWLNELLFILEREGVAFQQFEFPELSDRHVRAQARGVASPQVPHEVKAATYHSLTVRSRDRRLEATVVFDV